MANEFYVPGAQRAEKVGDLFATIAPRYDLINDLQSLGLHRRWKRRVADLAEVCPGDRALDVCCGTGDIAFALAERGAEVTGLDFSEAMLAVAESRRERGKRNAERGRASAFRVPRSEFEPPPVGNPRFMKGDAMQLPFPAGSFDVVTVGYGLRNLASWKVGLREMQRVAQPGGRLVVLDFGKPDNALWRSFYFAYLRFGVPVLGLLFASSAGAYRYILESLRHYPAQRGLAAEMSELGLVSVRTFNLLGGVMSIHCAVKAE